MDRGRDEGERKKHISRTVKVLGLVSFFTDASTEMIYPLLPIFLQSVLGVGYAFIGLIEGIAEGTASILKGYSGYVSDRLGHRKALIFTGYSLSTVAKPFFAAAQAGWQVLIIRFVDRVGKGIRTSPRDAMIAQTTDEDVRGKAYGFHRAMDTLGAVVGPGLAFLLMWLLKDLGDSRYRWVFLAAFIPGLIAVLLIVFVLHEKRTRGVREKAPRMWSRVFSRDFRVLLLVIAVFTLGNSSEAFLILRAKGLGVPVLLIPVVWLCFNAVYSLVSMPGGMLSDRIGRRKTLLIGMILYGMVYMGFAFARASVHAWLLFAAYGIFFGLTEGVWKAFVVDLAPRDLCGTAFGAFYLVDGFGKLAASVLFGLVWGLAGATAAFTMGASLAVIAGLILLFFLRDNRGRGFTGEVSR